MPKICRSVHINVIIVIETFQVEKSLPNTNYPPFLYKTTKRGRVFVFAFPFILNNCIEHKKTKQKKNKKKKQQNNNYNNKYLTNENMEIFLHTLPFCLNCRCLFHPPPPSPTHSHTHTHIKRHTQPNCLERYLSVADWNRRGFFIF